MSYSNWWELPDHPIIEQVERNGYPDDYFKGIVTHCTDCCSPIYDDDEYYYEFNGKPYCRSCIIEHKVLI